MTARQRNRSVRGLRSLLTAALVATQLAGPPAAFAAGDPDCSTGATCVTLHVSLSGAGSGSVWAGDTSGADNSTISCLRQNGSTLGTCAWEYAVRSSSRVVYVTADPKVDAAVCDSISCTTGRKTIAVTLPATSKGATVAFTFQWINPVNVAVSRTGNGLGTVTSNPNGISCGATCNADFPSGHQLSIVPHPAAGSEVVDVTVGGTSCWVALFEACNLTPDHNLTVVVTFGLLATPPPSTAPTPSPTPRPSATPISTPRASATPRPSSTAWTPPPSIRPGTGGKPTLPPAAPSALAPTPEIPTTSPGAPGPTDVVPTPFPSDAGAATAGAVAVRQDGATAQPIPGSLGQSSPTAGQGGIPIWIPIVLGGLLLGLAGSAFLVQRAAGRR